MLRNIILLVSSSPFFHKNRAVEVAKEFKKMKSATDKSIGSCFMLVEGHSQFYNFPIDLDHVCCTWSRSMRRERAKLTPMSMSIKGGYLYSQQLRQAKLLLATIYS